MGEQLKVYRKGLELCEFFAFFFAFIQRWFMFLLYMAYYLPLSDVKELVSGLCATLVYCGRTRCLACHVVVELCYNV